MLKTIEDLTYAIARRFEKTWADVACGLGEDAWPHAFALGRPSQADLAHGAGELIDEIDALRLWSDQFGFQINTEPRRMGAIQELPVQLVVPHADAAAALLGRKETERLARARRRAKCLEASFPTLASDGVRKVIRRVDTWNDVDVELLIIAGQWFATHDARGMTPRQVPLEGFHAKWLDLAGRRSLVCLLAGKQDLALSQRPREMLIAYLDPVYLQNGGKRYDICVEGDAWTCAYEPRMVVIVENKDSCLWFPEIEGGICVFGSGRLGPSVCSSWDWVRRAPSLFYWGDMDADGLEILNAYREAGLAVTSILMDLAAFDRYERYGTRLSASKRGLDEHMFVELKRLAPDERRLYERLCDASWRGALRIEQERIPLDVARAELARLLDSV